MVKTRVKSGKTGASSYLPANIASIVCLRLCGVAVGQKKVNKFDFLSPSSVRNPVLFKDITDLTTNPGRLI